MGYIVYIWGFSCLDYSSDVLIPWIQQLSLYNWFAYIYKFIHIWTIKFITILDIICLHDYFEYTTHYPVHLYFILTRHLAFILRTRWVAFLTASGFVCLDIRAQMEEDPTVADQAYLEKQATLQQFPYSCTDLRRLAKVPVQFVSIFRDLLFHL